MSTDAWITLAVVIVTVGLQAFERVSAAAALLGAAVVLLAAGILTPAEAFAGFGNPAPITVAALYVAARAVEKSGLLEPVTWRALGDGRKLRRSLIGLIVPIASTSGFINNTPMVAITAPLVTTWAHQHGISPSRYLMPLSYATILGGVITTIGTSTNLVVSGLLEADGQRPLGLFEMTPIGLPVAVVGCILLVWLAPILLPDRRMAPRRIEEGSRDYVVAMRVAPNGPLDGRSIENAQLRHLQGVFLFQIERAHTVIAPVAPTTILQGNDVLWFAGRVDLVVDLQSTPGLISEEAKHFSPAPEKGHVLVEAVVGQFSPLVGKTLREAEFRGHYQAAVLAIHRAGERLQSKLGSVRLVAGDTLLLLTDPEFPERWRHRRDFALIARLDGAAPTARRPLLPVVLIAVAMATAMTFGVPTLHASLVGAFAFVIARAVTAAEAVESIDVDVIVMIASSFALGLALEKTGLAKMLATGLVDLFSPAGTIGPILGIVVATALLTEIVSNNAAAALMYPIGAATAAAVGLDIRVVAIAVAIMASASFLTPIGYQTNIMVYGPGGRSCTTRSA